MNSSRQPVTIPKLDVDQNIYRGVPETYPNRETVIDEIDKLALEIASIDAQISSCRDLSDTMRWGYDATWLKRALKSQELKKQRKQLLQIALRRHDEEHGRFSTVEMLVLDEVLSQLKEMNAQMSELRAQSLINDKKIETLENRVRGLVR